MQYCLVALQGRLKEASLSSVCVCSQIFAFQEVGTALKSE